MIKRVHTCTLISQCHVLVNNSVILDLFHIHTKFERDLSLVNASIIKIHQTMKVFGLKFMETLTLRFNFSVYKQ